MITWPIALVLIVATIATASVLLSTVEKRHKRKLKRIEHTQQLDREVFDE